MIHTLFFWLKNNKLLVLLILVIIYLLFKNSNSTLLNNGYADQTMMGYSRGLSVGSGTAGMMSKTLLPSTSDVSQPAAPAPNVSNRMVVKESYLSLLVDKVTEIQNKILQRVQQSGGYMVSSSVDNPQDVATATVVVRIPTKNLDTMLSYFRSLSVKVVSENLQGTDVTDEYVDNDARLAILNQTKAKFEDILNKAVTVQDMLSVQQELINLQAQIDAIKGSQKYLEETASYSRVTIYLSTDELALPYAPTKVWRPQVIFKEAIRSLIGAFRHIGTTIIWIGVYAVIWLPVTIIAYLIYKKRKISS